MADLRRRFGQPVTDDRGEALLQLLDERFDRRLLVFAPYFFPDLADTTDGRPQSLLA